MRLVGRRRAFSLMVRRPAARESRCFASRLREFLPGRYGVTSGQVTASGRHNLRQWDILIYNALDTPVLHTTGDAAMLPIEGVLAAISVKSHVDGDALSEAVEAAERLREMPREALPTNARSQGPVPAVLVFGFQGLSLETLTEHTKRACQGPGSPRLLDGVCVLRSGLVVPVNKEGNLDLVDIENYRSRKRQTAHGGSS